LVHGDDIVASVAPSEPFGFRHVGLYVPATKGGKFTVPSGSIGSDTPGFAAGIANELRRFWHSPIGPDAAQLGHVVAALTGTAPPRDGNGSSRHRRRAVAAAPPRSPAGPIHRGLLALG